MNWRYARLIAKTGQIDEVEYTDQPYLSRLQFLIMLGDWNRLGGGNFVYWQVL